MPTHLRPKLTASVLAVALALLSAAGLEAQQTGAVTGVVRDATTNQPIQSAQIQVVGTTRGTLTNVNGRYRIENVPVGQVQVRAVLIGYAEATASATVEANQTAIVNLELESQAVSLDQIVVTATGEQRKRQVANQVTSINADEITRLSPITKVTDLLEGRASGVNILSSSGTTGAGQRIRIRGSSSIALQNDPVIYIDGIRVESGENSSSIGVGGQVPNRLSDLNPEDIESIEVIKGPSAATLYGTDAANGVIRVTTKRGELGSASVSAWVEGGVITEPNEYPANWTSNCLAFEVAEGCDPTALSSWNPLEEDISTPFENGSRQQYGMSVSGGNEALNYYVSGEWEQENNVFKLPEFDEANLREEFGSAFGDLPKSQFEPNFMERLNLRANFGGALNDELSFRVNTGYVSSDLNLPNNDNNVLGLIPSALLGTADDTEEGNFGYGFFLPSEVNVQNVEQDVERFTTSGQLDWQPLDWLGGRAVLGLDVVNRTDIQNIPRDRLFFGAQRPLGTRTVNRAQIFNYTVDLNSSARFRLADAVTSRTTVGVQYFRDLFTRSDAFGVDIAPGASSLGAAGREFAVNEITTESITLGAFVEQEFGIRDNLFVTAAVRGDDNSAFGNDFDFIVYPKFGVSWVATDEDWFPRSDVLNSLRLRTAWGRSGNQPDDTAALRFFTPVSVTSDDQDVTGVTIGELGNPDLEPEQSSEIEAGFDLGLFQERVGLDLTFYRKTTTDLLIQQPLPPSGGVGNNRFVNLGEVTNQGIEAGLTLTPVRNENVLWDLSLLASANENELNDLGNLPNGEPIPTIKQGRQWFQEEFPLGAYFDNTLDFNDADGNGIITPEELILGDEDVFLDEAIPTREASISTNITLWNRVRINGLLNHQGGHSLRNLTEIFRCQSAICEAINNPDAPLAEQARALAVTVVPADQQTEAGFIEDASFWKLRELGVTFFVPEDWSRRFGAERTSLTLTGRNLATWTDYTGTDPEVNQFGQANFLSRDFLTQPPVRFWTARVNLNF